MSKLETEDCVGPLGPLPKDITATSRWIGGYFTIASLKGASVPLTWTKPLKPVHQYTKLKQEEGNKETNHIDLSLLPVQLAQRYITSLGAG